MLARFGLSVFSISLAFIALPLDTQPVAAQAEDPPPFPEFTFRRITVPGPEYTGPRINIQITPEVTEAASAATPPSRAEEAPSDTDWFWAEVSAELPADPRRFWAAQDVIATAPDAANLSVPRLSDLTAMAQDHGRTLLAESVGTSVSPALALAVMAVESAGRVRAESGAGAQGLMQLIPATADRFGVSDPFDPGQNIAGGIAYLDWLMGEFDGDPVLALAAYNAGEGAVTRSGGVPEYQETRAYVPKVIAAWALARTLCLTPPELPSDGCVFTVMQ